MSFVLVKGDIGDSINCHNNTQDMKEFICNTFNQYEEMGPVQLKFYFASLIKITTPMFSEEASS